MRIVRMVRDRHTKYGTFGRLVTPKGLQLFTIERNWENNTPRTSCIPAATYRVRYQPSPRFGMAWRLANVDKRIGILIHPANYASELNGCISLGLNRNDVMITNSRRAQAAFDSEMGYGNTFLLDIKWTSSLAYLEA